MSDLGGLLDGLTGPAAKALAPDLGRGRIQCLACGHRCRIREGKRGICKVRFNRSGTLRVPSGYVAGIAVDPIEKKPFYHVLPGSPALSFGMLGCNLHCTFCQNWLSSQTLRDDAAGAPVRRITVQEIIDLAVSHGAPVVTSTYNEPLITAEWSVEIFDAAKEAGLRTAFVSNGHASPEALDFLGPRLDLMKVDLKSFRPESYRELGGRLRHVLSTIEGLVARRIWVEVVTLVVPGFNDSDDELRRIARFLSGLSPGIPWHVTAFHPDYRMRDRGHTRSRSLLRAFEIGKEEGLHYVYAGNAPGRVGSREDTRCPNCDTTLVSRVGYRIGAPRIEPDGTCPECATAIPGIWFREQEASSSLPTAAEEAILPSMENSESRRPRRDRDEKHPYFSCAFCSGGDPKPFEVCRQCGEAQPPKANVDGQGPAQE